MLEELQSSIQSLYLLVMLFTVSGGGSGLYFMTGRALFISHSIKSSMKGVVGSVTFDYKEVRIFVCLDDEASSKMETFVF